MSVKFPTFPLVADFQIFDVGSADWGFIVFAATPAEKTGLAIFNPGSMKLFHIFSVLKNFFFVFSNPSPSRWNVLAVKVISFSHLHVRLGHKSFVFNKIHLILKSHQYRLDIGFRWLISHFALSWKFDFWSVQSVWSVWFVYSNIKQKLCRRPQIFI